MCFDLTHSPVATAAARAAATGHGGDSHPETSSSPGTVGLARAHPLTKIQAMEPSRQTWSSYGPPYPLGRWSSSKRHFFHHLLSLCFLGSTKGGDLHIPGTTVSGVHTTTTTNGRKRRKVFCPQDDRAMLAPTCCLWPSCIAEFWGKLQ